MKQFLRPVFAVASGLGLSFFAIGILWIGTPWPIQALMFIPFLLAAYAVSATGETADQMFLLILGGAAPLGGILVQFRDKDDSHLASILTVGAWIAGTLLGHALAAARRRRQPAEDFHA